MDTLLTLLAVAGGAGAAWHLLRAALRFLEGGAHGIFAGEMERTHARRGDLTSLEEQRREREAARRASRRAALVALGWLALLAVPSLTPWPRRVFAAYSVVWLGPLARWHRAGRGAG
ncbi:MAG: hypothetical protein ACOCVZ_05280 [Gemmatimonadota bacterium]